MGTGSCLVPAAHLGAYTIGTDIDVRVIKLGEWLRGGGICMQRGGLCCLAQGSRGGMPRAASPSVVLNRPTCARMLWFPPGKKDKAGRPVNVWTNFEASSVCCGACRGRAGCQRG